jgi:hypothetical protein
MGRERERREPASSSFLLRMEVEKMDAELVTLGMGREKKGRREREQRGEERRGEGRRGEEWRREERRGKDRRDQETSCVLG